MAMDQNREHGGDAYLTTGAAARRLPLSTMTLPRALPRGETAPTVRTPGGDARFRVADVDRDARHLAGVGRTP